MTAGASAPGGAQLHHVGVLDALGRDIVAGFLRPEEPLTLEKLQERYGASRGIVRECMRVLEGAGLLRSQRRTGITVLPESSWNVYDSRVIRWRLEGPDRDEQLRQLTELRLGLEPVGARLAALHATESERYRIREAVAMMRLNAESDRMADHLGSDCTFHGLVLRASHNPMYAAMVDVVREVLVARRQRHEFGIEYIVAALGRHERVARAISDGDEFEAEAAMHDLLSEVREAVGSVRR